jgi:hypothetical protein
MIITVGQLTEMHSKAVRKKKGEQGINLCFNATFLKE